MTKKLKESRFKYWKILIVDDDEMLHFLTKRLLQNFQFEEKKLMFLHAYSKAEAEKVFSEHEDIAVILLDVVMEEWDSGLKFVEHVRKVVINNSVRIIIMTGQSKVAPEKQTIINYDINDYKTKQELTSKNKLFISILTALRSYRDIKKIEEYSKTLEAKVKERTRTIEIQNRRLAHEKIISEDLLLNTLPQKVVSDLKKFGETTPEDFSDVSVFFSDLVGFTEMSAKLKPQELISELNIIFTAFDDIMEAYNCERIKTIGDAYMAVSGMPEKDKNHAENIINASIEIIKFVEERNIQKDSKWEIRIGINSGNIVGGIVGVKKYIYDVFGDTINVASRMESNSTPMRINISDATYKLVQDKYVFSSREAMEIKGKGKMKMHFVDKKIERIFAKVS
ncbi:MAG: adenylate/guanylate cyclase domain-containing response regulator [Bacteroidota bacterium]|nr:adenylate/guanylate cyclase domain-containing response regulator [Bacteroidota bacterium]